MRLFACWLTLATCHGQLTPAQREARSQWAQLWMFDDVGPDCPISAMVFLKQKIYTNLAI